MRGRHLVAGGVASMLLVAGGTVVVLRGVDGSGGASGSDGADGDGRAPATAEVTRRDLEERLEIAGTLGYGDARDVFVGAAGTITALPAIGTIVDRGEMVVEIDGRPVPLLFGARPLWRQLGAGVQDGPDVEELEANLVALGVMTGTALTVDQHWTWVTTRAVEEWQESLGRDETGVVAPGDAVVLPGAVRVVEHPAPLGGPASGVVVKVTGTARRVFVDLDAAKASLIAPGQPVEVALPDGTATPGTVASVGTVARSAGSDDSDGEGGASGDDQGGGESTIEVVVALDDPGAAGSLDEAPVTVRVVTSAAVDVLAVPVDALLALAEGGYALETVDASGKIRLVAVETGAFADGWVEVTAEVAEGDEVVVPR